MEGLDKIAPKLSNVKKENPFKVPYNYFNDFNAKLQVKIKQEKKEIKPNPVLRILKPALSIAASFAVIFMLVYWPLTNFKSNQVASTEDEYFEYTIEDELIGLMAGLDDNALLALFNGEGEEETLSEDVVIEYLSENLSGYDICMVSVE